MAILATADFRSSGGNNNNNNNTTNDDEELSSSASPSSSSSTLLSSSSSTTTRYVNAIVTASVATISLVLVVISAFTCQFLSIVAITNDLLAITDYSKQVPQSETTIGLFFCSGTFYNIQNDDDTMMLISRIFAIICITLGCMASILSWLIVMGISTWIITKIACIWQYISVLAALASVLQVPIFLMYQIKPCVDFNDQQGCTLGIGSYTLICSITGWIMVTIITQCLEPPIPDWVENLNEWKIPSSQSRGGGRETGTRSSRFRYQKLVRTKTAQQSSESSSSSSGGSALSSFLLKPLQPRSNQLVVATDESTASLLSLWRTAAVATTTVTPSANNNGCISDALIPKPLNEYCFRPSSPPPPKETRTYSNAPYPIVMNNNNTIIPSPTDGNNDQELGTTGPTISVGGGDASLIHRTNTIGTSNITTRNMQQKPMMLVPVVEEYRNQGYDYNQVTPRDIEMGDATGITPGAGSRRTVMMGEHLTRVSEAMQLVLLGAASPFYATTTTTTTNDETRREATSSAVVVTNTPLLLYDNNKQKKERQTTKSDKSSESKSSLGSLEPTVVNISPAESILDNDNNDDDDGNYNPFESTSDDNNNLNNNEHPIVPLVFDGMEISDNLRNEIMSANHPTRRSEEEETLDNNNPFASNLSNIASMSTDESSIYFNRIVDPVIATNNRTPTLFCGAGPAALLQCIDNKRTTTPTPTNRNTERTRRNRLTTATTWFQQRKQSRRSRQHDYDSSSANDTEDEDVKKVVAPTSTSTNDDWVSFPSQRRSVPPVNVITVNLDDEKTDDIKNRRRDDEEFTKDRFPFGQPNEPESHTSSDAQGVKDISNEKKVEISNDSDADDESEPEPYLHWSDDESDDESDEQSDEQSDDKVNRDGSSIVLEEQLSDVNVPLKHHTNEEEVLQRLKAIRFIRKSSTRSRRRRRLRKASSSVASVTSLLSYTIEEETQADLDESDSANNTTDEKKNQTIDFGRSSTQDPNNISAVTDDSFDQVVTTTATNTSVNDESTTRYSEIVSTSRSPVRLIGMRKSRSAPSLSNYPIGVSFSGRMVESNLDAMTGINSLRHRVEIFGPVISDYIKPDKDDSASDSTPKSTKSFPSYRTRKSQNRSTSMDVSSIVTPPRRRTKNTEQSKITDDMDSSSFGRKKRKAHNTRQHSPLFLKEREERMGMHFSGVAVVSDDDESQPASSSSEKDHHDENSSLSSDSASSLRLREARIKRIRRRLLQSNVTTGKSRYPKANVKKSLMSTQTTGVIGPTAETSTDLLQVLNESTSLDYSVDASSIAISAMGQDFREGRSYHSRSPRGSDLHNRNMSHRLLQSDSNSSSNFESTSPFTVLTASTGDESETKSATGSTIAERSSYLPQRLLQGGVLNRISSPVASAYVSPDRSFDSDLESSYVIDLLDVQLAELRRPDGATKGADEESC